MTHRAEAMRTTDGQECPYSPTGWALALMEATEDAGAGSCTCVSCEPPETEARHGGEA